jgi:hypothetical protein
LPDGLLYFVTVSFMDETKQEETDGQGTNAEDTKMRGVKNGKIKTK